MSSVNWGRLFTVSTATFVFAFAFLIGNALSGIGSINLNDPAYASFGLMKPLLYVFKLIAMVDEPLSVLSFITACFAYIAKGRWPSGD